MKRLFWAFFFILLNFSITVGSATVQLIPTFVGFGLLVSACAHLAAESPLFAPLQRWGSGLCLYYILAWLRDLFLHPHGAALPYIITILDAAALLLTLYVTWRVVHAIANVEVHRNVELGSVPLFKAWKTVVMCALLSLVLTPLVMFSPALGAVASLCLLIAQAVATIFFLIRLWQVGKNYEQAVRL